MLELKIDKMEFFDESTSNFITVAPCALKLEHSLISLSKWEAKWHKPFIDNKDKTPEEVIDYIKCMTLNKNEVSPLVYIYMSKENVKKINEYIENPMTATWFSKNGRPSRSRQVITSELIYYWMTAYNIPFSCEKWHINRLLTLIKICNEKEDTSGNKMSKRQIMSQNRALNAARRKKYNTKG